MADDIQALKQSLDSWVRGASTCSLGFIGSGVFGLQRPNHVEHLTRDLQQVDSLVDSLQSGMHSAHTLRAGMRRQLNACAPINKLPVEILRMIYTMCTFGAPPLGEPQGHVHGARHVCFIISHTCSHWRAVSLDFPTMWSRIRLAGLSHEFQEAILERTKNFPLEVWLDVHRPLSDSLSKINMNILCRAKMLEMHVHASVDVTLCNFLTTAPPNLFPALEAFSLQFSQQPSHLAHVNLVLQRPLFAGCTPRLRHLRLDGVRMPWARGFYSNLTTLRLVSCEAGSRVTMDHDVCSILQDSPYLENLEISLYRSQLPETDPLPPHGGARVSLPALRMLKLFCGLGYVRHLLASIDAPNLDTMDVRICDLYPDHFHAALSEGGLLPRTIASTLAKLRIEVNAHELEIRLAGTTAAGRAAYMLTWCFVYHAALGEVCGALCALHAPVRELEVVSDAHAHDAPPALWTEHPAAFAACLRAPALEGLMLVGDITAVLLPQMLHDYALVTDAAGWPRLARLGVRAQLDGDAIPTLAMWCARRPALRSLDLSGSVLHVPSAASIPGVVNLFHGKGFSVLWSDCQFHDDSAQHTFRHPEVLWPHLFSSTGPRRRSPLQYMLSVE